MFYANQKIGQYTLIKKIARGGFGEVWLAEKQSPLVTKKVAIKLPLDDQIDIETIRQEATLWEEASGHPNVVPLIDADIYDGQVVIVSEFAEGGSLDDKLKETVFLPIEQAIEITIGILNGLEYLHSKKIIHRDIKPANILIHNGTPRLTDFGISRAMRTDTISTGVYGTVNYMSPESFEGVRSEQADIWSVGVLLYKLLTGKLPFPQLHPKEAMYAIITKEPESLPAEIPIGLQEIVYKSLAKNTRPNDMPPRRYSNAAEMRADLQEMLKTYLSEPTFTTRKVSVEESRELATKMRIKIRNKSKFFWQKANPLKMSQTAVFFAILALGGLLFLASAFMLNRSTENAENKSENINVLPTVEAQKPTEQTLSEEDIIKSKALSLDGDKFYTRKKYNEAIEAYTQAIVLNPKDYSFFNNRGVAYHAKGEFENAIADYSKAVELNPKHFSSFNNRGAAYEDLGLMEQAIEDYQKATELDPENKTAQTNLKKALKKK